MSVAIIDGDKVHALAEQHSGKMLAIYALLKAVAEHS